MIYVFFSTIIAYFYKNIYNTVTTKRKSRFFII